MRYVYPIPGEMLWWASTLHVAGLVLLVAKLLDHLRYVFAPGRWPLFIAMVSTWIGERYVQLRHPAWYRQIREEREGAPARSEAPRPRPPSPTTPPPSAVGSMGTGGQ
jgi:hypothetical protein